MAAPLPHLEGRVFKRLQRFHELPPELQHDTKAAENYLTLRKAEVFRYEHASLVKSVYGVRGNALVDWLVNWLNIRAKIRAEHNVHDQEQGEIGYKRHAFADTTAQYRAVPREEVEQQQPPSMVNCGAVRAYATQIVEALVLSGFLKSYKDKEEKNPLASLAPVSIADNDLLVPTAKGVTEFKSTSVWNVVDGAIYAKWLKRKGGFLGGVMTIVLAQGGKDTYVVVNAKTKKLYLFESDLAYTPIVERSDSHTCVAFDASHFDWGVKVCVCGGDKAELLNAGTKANQQTLMQALLQIGVHYREGFHGYVDHVQSFYELSDVDLSGQEVSMVRYRGQVLIVINIPTFTDVTTAHYPELMELEKRYHDQGLIILLFPSAQFVSQDTNNSNDGDKIDLPSKYLDKFEVFKVDDVNGPHARAVFAYLKAKLRGKFGSYVDGDFTKFIVDRDGQPYKRFASDEMPMAMEHELQLLLSRKVTLTGSTEPWSSAPEPISMSGAVPNEDVVAFETKKEAHHEYETKDEMLTKGMTRLRVTVMPGEIPEEHGAGEKEANMTDVLPPKDTGVSPSAGLPSSEPSTHV